MPDAQSVLSWSDRWCALRDRMLASPRFQRGAAALWLTRPIARRRASALFDLCAGFVYSQVLFSCVHLNIFGQLANGPRPRRDLAQSAGLSDAAADTLFDAAVALKLLEARSAERIGLGVLGAAMNGNPGVAAMVEHHALFYADLTDPIALLRGADRAAGTPADPRARVVEPGSLAQPSQGVPGDVEPAGTTRLSRYWSYVDKARPASLAGADVGAYTALMSASQPLIASQILAAYRLSAHRCLIDVGGGDGTFIESAAARARRLRFILFDLPAVADKARLRFAQAGLADRTQAVGGDFLNDALPSGADVACLIRVIHDHTDAAALSILQAVRRALPSGGVLLLAEPMAAMRGAQAVGDAYFGFYLLAMGRGRPRTALELTDLLVRAGFEDIRRIPTHMPLQTALLAARAAPGAA